MKWIASLTLIGLFALAFTTFATPPVATPSFGQTWEDTEGEVILNYTDDDGDLATDCHVYNVVGGTVQNISVVEGVCTVTFIPDLNNDVNVTGEFMVLAGGELSNSSTFELDLIEVNDPPVLIADPPTNVRFGEEWFCVIMYDDPEDDNIYLTFIGDHEYAPIIDGELIENGAVVYEEPFYHGPVDFIMFLMDDGFTNGEYDPQASDTSAWRMLVHPFSAVYEIDNSDPQFVIISGNWQTFEHPDAKGGSLLYHTRGYGERRAGWRVDQLVEPGLYEMYVWNINTGYNSISPRFQFITYHAYGIYESNSFHTNRGYNMWDYIGTWPITNGRVQGTTIINQSDGFVYADAIRYIKVDELQPDGDIEPGLIDQVPVGERDQTWGVLQTQAEVDEIIRKTQTELEAKR